MPYAEEAALGQGVLSADQALLLLYTYREIPVPEAFRILSRRRVRASL